MIELKAKEGYYLTNKDRTIFIKAIIGASVKAEDYEEIIEEEAKPLMEQLAKQQSQEFSLS